MIQALRVNILKASPSVWKCLRTAIVSLLMTSSLPAAKPALPKKLRGYYA